MRKFTMFVLLATSAIPAMAAAQEEEGRQGRHQQSDQSDNNQRPAREDRAERQQQRSEAREQMQAQRQMQVEQRQAQDQQQQAQAQQQQGQVEQQRAQIQQQVQVERQRDGGGNGRRDRRETDPAIQQDGRGSNDERMQQWREQREQRRAQSGGQQPSQGGGLVPREGRYRSVPDINPNAGQPAPENRNGRLARRDDHRDRPNWVNNWRGDRRYDWRNYRDHHRSSFRIGFYFDPFGYSYRRFGVGSYMYPGYYQSNYWINDPWQYRLPPAYGPYRWVRYHNDALLIDTWSGEVVDVIYGFFW